MVFSSEDISLRPVEAEDTFAMYCLENDSSIWLSSGIVQPTSRQSIIKFLSDTKNDIYKERQLRLAIEKRQQKQVVGFVDLFNFNPRHLRAEVGIGILNQYRKFGYAKESLHLLSEYASNVLFLHQLYACVLNNNEVAKNLFEIAGYKEISSLKDWYKTKNGFESVVIFQKIL